MRIVTIWKYFALCYFYINTLVIVDNPIVSLLISFYSLTTSLYTIHSEYYPITLYTLYYLYLYPRNIYPAPFHPS